MAIEPQSLYDYLMLDPDARGYPSMSFEGKQDAINEVRNDVTVTRTTEDNVGPGKVSEPIPVQIVRDAITPDEYAANCFASSGDTTEVIAEKAGLRDWISLIIGGSAGDSQLGFTELLKAQILATFSNADWPDTRANLIDAQTREGSDSEAQWGLATQRSDMLDAEQYAIDNSLPSLYLQ